MSQLNLNIYKGQKGGRRPGAGRRRVHSKGVAHRKREKVNPRYALHINFKVKASIRNKHYLKILGRAILNARSHGLGIVHFSLQSNHIHLSIEAKNNAILSKGMRSLTITFSKGLQKGRIQLERYHLHVLKTLRETRNAVHYVLFNQQKHHGLKKAYIDDFTPLGFVKDLKVLAKSAKMTVILRKIQKELYLDVPAGWMIRQILNQQIC